MKAFTLILAVIWFFGWGFWFLYERGHIQSVPETIDIPVSEEAIDTNATPATPEPIVSFLMNHPPRDSIDIIIDSLMALRKSDESIQVISFYTDTLAQNNAFENPGIERSVNLIQKASQRYAERVLQPIGLKLRKSIDTTGISTYYMVVKRDKTAPMWIVNDHRVVVFFPYASHNEMDTSKISGVLDSLSNIWKGQQSNLIITGYTDNTANESTNYNLGLQRANSIQKIIVDNGFPEERINTHSQGEKYPLSLNTTPDGRYLNRRVEILVDK